MAISGLRKEIAVASPNGIRAAAVKMQVTVAQPDTER
jgi:hypothetical protein